MGLKEYKAKRNFAIPAEPAGEPLSKVVKGASRFVIPGTEVAGYLPFCR